MGTMRLPLLMLGVSGLLLVGGCKALSGCSNPETYSGAQDLPRLKIPVGLDGLDTDRALDIPPLSQPAAPRDADSCLEEPPAMREPGSSSPTVSEERAREEEPATRRNRPVSPPR
jgi:hypothetical protein